MKKRFLSAVFVLLMMFLLLPTASADVLYPAPDSVQAGQPIEHLVATVTSDAQISCAGLPEGLRLDAETQGAETNVFLRGAVQTPGSYDCIIYIGSTSFTCPVRVTPEPPGIYACPDLICYLGDSVQISVSPSVSKGGTLSYQWYVSGSPDTPGIPVDGAIGAELPLLATQVGTQYFVCAVTNSVGGMSASALSPAIAVTVEELTVTAISVESLPERTDYVLGETLDTAGLSIRATLANGGSRVITEDFGVWPTRLDAAGTQNIEISYQGQTASFTVDVRQDMEDVEGIGVLTLPKKTSYALGERLDSRGLSIRVYTGDGYRDVSEGLSCSPTSLEVPGTQTVTVSYGGKTCTFSVEVEQAPAPVTLTIASLPVKLRYAVGEPLDATGLVLREINSRNEVREVHGGYTCTPSVLERAGQQEITVRFGELSCSFHVTVAEAAPAAPSPTVPAAPALTPAATAAPPVTPAVSPSSARSAPAHSGGRLLFTIIIIASLIALAALGGYVFVMNQGGFAQAAQSVREWIDRIRRR